jgi:hypothetical protein
MRLPLDSIFVTNPFGQAGYGVFGKHAGLDLRAAVGTNVYAPADGVITEKYVGTGGIQVLSMRIGALEHRFLHLSAMYPTVGESVRQGQLIAKSGNTGNVAAHLHWDVRKAGTAWNRSFSDYVNPLTLIQGGSEVATRAQVNNIYKAVLHREGDEGGLNTYTGKDANTVVAEMLNSAEFKNHQNFLGSVNQTLTDQANVILSLSSRPTKQELDNALAQMGILQSNLAAEKARADKVVEVIKEVPVEVIKEPKWLEATINFIRGVLRIK